MPNRFAPIVALIVVLILAMTSMFTINEAQVAIRTEFGAIVGLDYSPGLHWKWPWDQVVKFDRRILSLSYTSETFLTNDNRGLIVDFYVKWKVNNASRYFEATGGQEELAGQRIADVVKDGIKGVVAQRTLEEIVSADRAAVTDEMIGQASHNVANLGVDLVDVRVQRIDLPDEVSTRVYESMKQNFAKIADKLRAEGQSASVPLSSRTPSGMRCAPVVRAMGRRPRPTRTPTRATRSSTPSIAACRRMSARSARMGTC
jgi:modulator of FtsH protease HflC